MVQRHLVHLPAACRQAKDAAHDLLIDAEFVRDITHARRPKTIGLTKQWHDPGPDRFLIRAHADFVIGPPQPRAVDDQRTLTDQMMDGGGKQRCRQARLQG
ncbi:MAG TPA: hypothetical protein VFE34_01770 [Dongiaceae bacterium]|nr:hypothetical protein [Dongiaceae bacterium]